MRLILALILALLGGAPSVFGASSADKLSALDQFGRAFERVLNEYYVEPDSHAMIASAYQAMVDKFLPNDPTLKARKLDATGDVFGGLAQFGDGFEAIRQRAGVSDADLIAVAINGMLQSLDQRNQYFDPVALRSIRQNQAGEIVGIGAEIAKVADAVRVVAPLDGSPAARAGVVAGDLIIAIDGQSVAGLSLQEATGRLRGTLGARVRLTLRREGVERPIEVAVVRNKVQVRIVTQEVVDTIGYMRLSTLNGKAADALQKGYTDLRKRAKTPLRGYVLDLRNNTGGLFDEAVAVVDAFLNEGLIVSVRNREGAFVRHSAKKGGLLPAPLVVLVNSGTSSGAEIVAAALQDHRRAIIVGGQTNGTGLNGVLQPLGDGAILLMTAQYYRPSGAALHRNGVAPDHVVRSDPAAGSGIPSDRLLDRQLQYAIAVMTGKPLPSSAAPEVAPAGAAAESPAKTGDGSFDELEDLGTLD